MDYYNIVNSDNMCQLDGNATVSSMSTSDEESNPDVISEPLNNSSEEEDSDNEGKTDCETEGEATERSIEDEDDEEERNSEPDNGNEIIQVIVGNRPLPPAPETREPTRITVKRDNKLVNALSTPRMTLYNVRSAWSKWGNIADDMEQRETDLSFYTEVWEQSENKIHQKVIESMFELKGIKYISTPRPGAKRC